MPSTATCTTTWRSSPACPGAPTALIERGTLTYLPGQHVWTLSAGQDGCLIRALVAGPPAAETVVRARLTVLATGAMDRPLPFPGWDLPGVMTVGGLQSLLKGHGVLAGQRVLLAGTGPLLLSAAAGVVARGGTVTGVLESARQRAWARHLPALARVPEKLAEGARYAAVLARHGVTVRSGVMVTAAHGQDRVRSVTTARIGRDGHAEPGRERLYEADVLAVGWGFTPGSSCTPRPAASSAPTRTATSRVTVDDDQFTSNPVVLAAGEPTGIGGASLAVTEGQIAGIAAARRLGRGAAAAASWPAQGPPRPAAGLRRRPGQRLPRPGRVGRAAHRRHGHLPVRGGQLRGGPAGPGARRGRRAHGQAAVPGRDGLVPGPDLRLRGELPGGRRSRRPGRGPAHADRRPAAPRPPRRRRPARGRRARGPGQEIAAFTSSATFFSTMGLHFLSAYATGHMSPSSRLAASWKPRVEYR